MDDESLIEELLYRGEGAALDYKVQQYPFSGADDGQKSELLKDILAFANAWRTETAYILIGVKNDSRDIVDLDSDIDDSRLQEFINAKTNHPVIFSYRSLDYKGVKLGLYTIPVQDRPIFVKKKYGRVEPNVVYVRRGSSTALADPTEVAKMGASMVAHASSHAPKLTLTVVNADSMPTESFSMEYENLELLPDDKYPDYPLRTRNNMHGFTTLENREFYREFAHYAKEAKSKRGFAFEVSNSGDNFADDVRLYLSLPKHLGFDIKDEYDLVRKPSTNRDLVGNINRVRPAAHSFNPKYSINKKGEEVVVTYFMGKILAGETQCTPTLFIIAPPTTLESMPIRILSDQLRSPIELRIPVKVKVESKQLSVDNLMGLFK